jgi:hypothetical protein
MPDTRFTPSTRTTSTGLTRSLRCEGYDVCTRNEIYVDPTQLRGLPWTSEDWDPEPLGKALEPVIAAAVTRNQAAWNQRRSDGSCEAD